ncbi:phosphomannomutase/phosphoglucomutase [Spirochaetales bacterium NM-380-WT-3C1]|uniref:Phosphomannomutase/phosphoglucomutase n=1 Tax=Bullifex porci TaxID=2606638 RepID=A0A7X2PAV1_9SPIO|nr:phosphomannomutase/phosphoglucomutase [Bullifex porci]MSU05372.1 phosphomannomutase/phosphoglucomutase [Bullifex porci]
MGAFKAYDIRGVYNVDFDKNTAYKVGYFLPSLLNASFVAVGRDVRVSSDEIHDALVKGITDSGADVYDLGLATTPMVYFATTFLDASASVQITASHNPPKYNGLKISRKGALPVGGETGLKDLEKLVNEGEVKVAEKKGQVFDRSDVKDSYVEFLRNKVSDLSNLKISMDLSHGMANLVIKDVLKEYNDNIHYLYDHFDGTFPAHEPNPLEVENCKDLMKAVVEDNSDCGVIYDGDADRVMFIDEKGRFIQPDYITAVIGLYYSKSEKGNVLQDIRTSRSTSEYLEKLGFNVTTWKVGHAFAKLKIREINGIFGGELAGHYYFRDFGNCDSGVLASLLVLSVVSDLKRNNKTLSSLIDEIIKYQNSGEVNFKLENKDAAINALYQKYVVEEKANKVLDFDGYRIEFDSWWFNVRKSNTEPYLRIVLEAQTKEEMEKHLKDISDIIHKFN